MIDCCQTVVVARLSSSCQAARAHKKTHFFSTKDAGVQSNVDREEAEEKTAKSSGQCRRGIKATVALGQGFS